jgi:hypothetical protein
MFDLLSLSRKATALTVYAGIAFFAPLLHVLAQTQNGAVAPLPGPANDNFANALTVIPGTIAIPADAGRATLELNEPAHSEQTGSIWFRWTPEAAGSVHVATSEVISPTIPHALSTAPAFSDESIFYPFGGIGFVFGDSNTIWLGYAEQCGNDMLKGSYLSPPQFSAYRGSSVDNLQPIGTGTDLDFDVQAGETIWIALETGSFVIPPSFFLHFISAPLNDSFASAPSVQDSSAGSFEGSLSGSTRELGEPDLGADFSAGSVWFDFIPATYGQVTITEDAGGAPAAVFTGTEIGSLQLIAKDVSGSLTFFAETDKTYHLCVYRGAQRAGNFHFNYQGPTYREYLTTVTELMPNGLLPHFYGVRGTTMLLYAKAATGWNCVEIEPISGEATDLLIYPAAAVDGKLRVVTIEGAIPPPHVEFSVARGNSISLLVGVPGQTCAVSHSTDLKNWSRAQGYILSSPKRTLQTIETTATVFYRITQSLPAPIIGAKVAPAPHQ